LVGNVFTSLPDRRINYLFLVGGFAESPLLRDRVKREFQDRAKVIIPNDPGVVVLKGASMFGVDPSVVKVRRSRMTYGVGVLHPFNPKIHPQGLSAFLQLLYRSGEKSFANYKIP
jgi:hypothetical protein